MSRKTV